MSAAEAAAAARALTHLATATSGLSIRTTQRSLNDPHYKLEQELSGFLKGLSGQIELALIVAALAVAVLSYRWEAAPWLSGLAALGLGGCAARLAYWHVRHVLRIPQTWSEEASFTARVPILWPSLMALSGALALVASIAGTTTGHAPVSGGINTLVIGGAAALTLGGALMAWSRTRSSAALAADHPLDATDATVAGPV